MRLPATSLTPPLADAASAAPVTGSPRATPATAAAIGPSGGTAPAADVHALRELVDKLSQTIGTTGQHVQFSIDQDTHQTVLKVTDAESGALLRQIPGDEALSMARILDRMQGILISQKA